MKNFKLIAFLGLSAALLCNNLQANEHTKKTQLVTDEICIDISDVSEFTTVIIFEGISGNRVINYFAPTERPMVCIIPDQVIVPEPQRSRFEQLQLTYEAPFVDTRWIWINSTHYNC